MNKEQILEEQSEHDVPAYCGKTIDEIRAMRQRYGHLFIAEIKDGDKTHYAVCKEPTIQVVEAAQTIAKTSEVKAAMSMYDNCTVLVDDEIKKRDLLKLQVAGVIGKHTASLESGIKNV